MNHESLDDSPMLGGVWVGNEPARPGPSADSPPSTDDPPRGLRAAIAWAAFIVAGGAVGWALAHQAAPRFIFPAVAMGAAVPSAMAALFLRRRAAPHQAAAAPQPAAAEVLGVIYDLPVESENCTARRDAA